MPRYEGRLELTWTNKDLCLLAHDDGTYEWLPAADYRVAEVRLLNDVETVGEVAKKRLTDNLLIQGDALHALRSLYYLPEFRGTFPGKVKLAYIDPPFNTGQAFDHYDDALEHSVWLTMMRDRLMQIKALLADDGTVWVHLDDAEVHHARVVLDEVFGAQNFVGTIAWEKADSPRNSARFFSVDQDYIHVYAKDAASWRPNKLPRTELINAKYTNPDGDPRGPWFGDNLRANKPYSLGTYEVTGPTGKTFSVPKGKFWRISKDRFLELDAAGQIWWGPKRDAFPTFKRYLSEVGDMVPRTLWVNSEVGSNRTSSNEIKALFPGIAGFSTPKPEKLLERIITIGSQPGDLVLDCFLGSGTTAAVAHKMGRRWVGIERSATNIETFTMPRLEKVVDGSDQGGISKTLDWSGGGGFRHVQVGSSMFDADGGQVFLADEMTNGVLAEATAAQLGFAYDPDVPFAGRKGRTRLAVVDGVVNEGVVRLLALSLGSGERMVVCGTGIDPEIRPLLRELAPGSTLRKIPSALLDRYRAAQVHEEQRLKTPVTSTTVV